MCTTCPHPISGASESHFTLLSTEKIYNGLLRYWVQRGGKNNFILSNILNKKKKVFFLHNHVVTTQTITDILCLTNLCVFLYNVTEKADGQPCVK